MTDAERSALPHNGYDTIIDYVRQCIADDAVQLFYACRPWKRLRREVLEADRGECQTCKARGRYARATHVHHVRHVRDYPELAMSKEYADGGGTHRQLVSLCFDCHRLEHPDEGERAEPLTVERWD